MSAEGKIAVIGAGLMGAGIAQVFAVQGYDVMVCDPVDSTLATLQARVRKNLASIDVDVAYAERIFASSEISEAVNGAVAVFEAAPEKLELKQSIFEQLDSLSGDGTILASNTSVIPITKIAERVKRRERVLGTHWWNPPFLIPLVEVVPIAETAEEVTHRMLEMLSAAGKRPVRVRKDVPGFVGNRLQHALWREAHALIADGICDPETVDIVVKNSFGMRLSVLGPIENADLVGLDLTRDIHDTILPELSTRAEPSPALIENIEAGRLGFKSGKGFLDWTDDEIAETRARLSQHLLATLRKK